MVSKEEYRRRNAEQEARYRNKYAERWLSWWRNPPDRFTFFLVFFTASLVAATVALWCATRDLVRDGEDTARRQLRAYLVAENMTVGPMAPGELLFGFTMTNVGQTPVYDVDAQLAIDLREYPLSHGIPMQAHLAPRPAYFAKSTSPRSIRSRPFAPGEVEKITDASAQRLYMAGQITYKDVFDIERHTNFCVMYAKTRDLGPQFVRCDDLPGEKLNYAD